MDKFFYISEDKIRKAYEEGEFDNLPGQGKPLPPDKLKGIPDDLRMAYRVMQNSGFTPEEMDAKKELMTIEDLIRHSEDKLEAEELRRQLNEKLLKYNSMLSKKRIKTNSSVFKRYEHKIEKKFFD
ncbi:DUF1992 domain-containing protein [Siminovitchia acidinfaciens]|uniref:DUF1992 domain-containing protein n=1 Tax=Siminovitchia acidinfaciens TaxID=2321395 RepID=A0A429XVT2_9BACI|nr:DUF1992 domain-containing protein [Siminovitchia acidinfaciens]RST72299.1 DUF1992 domain-containing protein [Siminovitchia acidinfaciens]